MSKRFQVFISSTYEDLAGARQEVSQALLRADCFPAGMELFPAADEEQFEFIKKVIDQSDYYIVISAGRYGSVHSKKKISFTEMEYDYAIKMGKTVVRLLHKDPFNKLRGDAIEQTDIGRNRLKAFREKLCDGALVRFWEDAKELGAEVVYGIMDARQRRPAIGWVRADGQASQQAELEIAELKRQVAELELKAERSRAVQYLQHIRSISEATDSAMARCLNIELQNPKNVSRLELLKEWIISCVNSGDFTYGMDTLVSEIVQRFTGVDDSWGSEISVHLTDILVIYAIIQDDGYPGANFQSWSRYMRSKKFLEA